MVNHLHFQTVRNGLNLNIMRPLRKFQTNEFEANVSVIEDNSHILYPAGSFLKSVDADGVKAFRYDSSILRITPVTDHQSVKEYTVMYEQPRYDIAELRKIKNSRCNDG